MSEELKPCPFCGGTKIGIRDENDEADGMIWAYCKECGAMGEWDYTLQKAAEHWNRRADNAEKGKR